MLDTSTLIRAFVLDDLVFAAALWLAVARRDRHDVRGWCASLVLSSIALLPLGPKLREGALLVATVVVVNALVGLSLTLRLSSLFAFYRRPFARPWHLAAALGCGLVAGVLATHPVLRYAALAVPYGAGMAALGLAARRFHSDGPGHGHRLLFWGALGDVVAVVGRAVAAPALPPAHVADVRARAILLVLILLAHVAGLATTLAFLWMHRERLEHESERLAMTDALTGVYNRRTLFELGDKELSRARRTGASLSLIILDLDHFKRINDKYGHLGGDAILLRFVEVVRGCLRTSDVLTRYGGEEFCILLPDVGVAGAKVVGERIRATVEASTFFVGAVPLKVTASVGVAALPAGAEVTLSSLVQRADQALYIAKRDGRNRVSVSKAA